jgi:hypothetical protein
MVMFAMRWGSFSIPYFRLFRHSTGKHDPGNWVEGKCNGILPRRINKYGICQQWEHEKMANAPHKCPGLPGGERTAQPQINF